MVYSLELGAFCLDGGNKDGKMSPLHFLTKGLVPLVSQFSDYKPETETDEKQYYEYGNKYSVGIILLVQPTHCILLLKWEN